MQVLRLYAQTSNALVATRKTPPAQVACDAHCKCTCVSWWLVGSGCSNQLQFAQRHKPLPGLVLPAFGRCSLLLLMLILYRPSVTCDGGAWFFCHQLTHLHLQWALLATSTLIQPKYLLNCSYIRYLFDSQHGLTHVMELVPASAPNILNLHLGTQYHTVSWCYTSAIGEKAYLKLLHISRTNDRYHSVILLFKLQCFWFFTDSQEVTLCSWHYLHPCFSQHVVYITQYQ